MEGFTPIEDYAVIGNCRTAALVSKGGSIDWLCLPRFDSGSLFGALLDREKGGRFRVRPTGDFEVERRYVEGTVVLETTFRTAAGELVLTDLMPVSSEEDKSSRGWPDHQVLRRLACTRGAVEVEVTWEPRPDYGRGSAPVEAHGALGFWCQTGPESMVLLADLPLGPARDGRGVRGTATLEAGQVRWLSFTYTWGGPAVILPLGEHAEALVGETERWWRAWSSRMEYDGPWPDAVRRSALTLKLLSYAPSGALVAAPTTSLPEVTGGRRNWDYRYCWLRDASWMLRALYELGYREEADAFYDWIDYATRPTSPDVQTLYDVHGGTDLEERELGHLEGYRASRPVHVGNGAHDQLQLDVYGEVVAAAYEFARRGGTLDSADKDLLTGIGGVVRKRWREPDDGIWEIRGPRRHHTYSKVMCWTALDRLVRMHEEGLLADGVPVDAYRGELDAIREDVEARGVDPERDCYTGTYDRELVDAALLRIPAAGYVKASDERFRRTFRRIHETLDAGDGLLYRYARDFDDLPGREGAFDLCAFWSVECQAMAGEIDAAEAHFKTLLGHANDVGLYAEETDPETGAFLGNFPQGFTHLGLINAALTLASLRGEGTSDAEGSPWSQEQAPEGERARRPHREEER